jgi:hypothetical protein
LGVSWPHTVERYTLVAAPRIEVIFMNIREDGDPQPPLHSLHNMFQDPTYVTNTIVPSCGPAATCVHFPSCGPDVPWQNYTHAARVEFPVLRRCERIRSDQESGWTARDFLS